MYRSQTYQICLNVLNQCFCRGQNYLKSQELFQFVGGIPGRFILTTRFYFSQVPNTRAAFQKQMTIILFDYFNDFAFRDNDIS